SADDEHDVHTRSLVVIEAARYLEHAAELTEFAEHVVLRLDGSVLPWLDGEGEQFEALRVALRAGRIAEIEWSDDAADSIARIHSVNPALLISVHLRYGGDSDAAFWPALEAAARQDHVAAIHLDSGPTKSYHLVPRVDAFLKGRLLRARVQLISSGGDTDTQASAA